jgi:NTP pyrophosphatase (non-canonical NTP hydrolase)
MPKTIAEMTAEIREINVAKGWRPAEGGPGDNTWGDYIALLHSEISEALEAYRDHRLTDATGPAAMYIKGALPKPEGVGSEFADELIRLLDMCDVFGLPVSGYDYLSDVHRLHDIAENYSSFGDYMSWLHDAVSCAWHSSPATPKVLRVLVTVADIYGIDLDAEYERKIAYNRTRAFQHGGRTLAGEKARPAVASVKDQLMAAIPDDPRDWWTGVEACHFLEEWERLGLPELKLSDATGEVLTLWCADEGRAAEMLGLDDNGNNWLQLRRGTYEVSVGQHEEKETKDA